MLRMISLCKRELLLGTAVGVVMMATFKYLVAIVYAAFLLLAAS